MTDADIILIFIGIIRLLITFGNTRKTPPLEWVPCKVPLVAGAFLHLNNSIPS